MKFLVLFCLFATVAALSRPFNIPKTSKGPYKRPIIGGPATKDPKQYENKVWQYVYNVNERNSVLERRKAQEVGNMNAIPEPNTLIPVQVISAVVTLTQGYSTVIEVEFAEATCAKNNAADLEISAANCKLLPNGKHSVWNVYDLFRAFKKHEIEVSKVRDVQQEDEPTSTQSTNRGYTVSDDTEPIIGKRNARDLKNVYEWH
ncbi:hypothetical protein CAEBREN_02741 [Caenorhabditis brenneri]|uniref:Cystatin domain-containing protein n=1 Tax=Caenorhabditis brenneri TaxID=135651 RepID=G0NW11_CAEBE|nr:hypothetical protein CAEBREN_02741 [Caenorhabditis brenneri]